MPERLRETFYSTGVDVVRIVQTKVFMVRFNLNLLNKPINSIFTRFCYVITEFRNLNHCRNLASEPFNDCPQGKNHKGEYKGANYNG